MTRFFSTALLLLAALAPLCALAQEAANETQIYDPTFMGRTNAVADRIMEQKQRSLADKGFIKPRTVEVSIVRHDYMEDDQFGLQMAVPDVVSGCFDLTPLEYEAKFIDPYFLDIKVKHYRRLVGENGGASCDAKNKMSTGVMVLSRADLARRGTKEIRFSTENGSDTYKIILDGNRLELVPESMVVFRARNLSGALNDRISFQFKGSQMVTLQVPMAENTDDVSGEIMQFAAMNGLSPAPDAPASRKIFYFMDQNGSMASRIGPDGYGEVGQIVVGRPYDGAGGRKLVRKNLTVFVTRPGTEL